MNTSFFSAKPPVAWKVLQRGRLLCAWQNNSDAHRPGSATQLWFSRLCGLPVVAFSLALAATALGQSGPTYRGEFIEHVVRVNWFGECDTLGRPQTNTYPQTSFSLPLHDPGDGCPNWSLTGTLNVNYPETTPEGTIDASFWTFRFTSPFQRSADFTGRWQLNYVLPTNDLRIDNMLSGETRGLCPDALQTDGPGLSLGSYPVWLTRDCSTDVINLRLKPGTDDVIVLTNSLLATISAPGWAGDRTYMGVRVEVLTYYRLSTAAGIELSPDELKFQVAETNPPPQLITLHNSGTADLTFAVAIAGAGEWLSVSPSAGTLAPGQATNLNVTVVAADLPANLTNTALISVSGNAANSPQIVAVEVVQTPVRLIGLEVVQVVQDWRNSVPLIAKKNTTVRAHLQSLRGQPVRVTGKLRVFRNGSEILPPIGPSNPGGFIMAQNNAPNLRHEVNNSLNFQLPKGCTEGTVTLRLDAADVTCRESASTPNDCAVTVVFTPDVPAKFKIVSFVWVDAHGNLNSVSPHTQSDLSSRIISCFPLAGPGTRFDFQIVDWEDAVPPQLELVNERLNWMSFLNTLLSPDNANRLCFGAVAVTNRYAGLALLPGDVCSGFVPKENFVIGRHTISHELAHCLGRHHAPYCGAVVGPEAPVFPYVWWFPAEGRPALGPMFNGPDELVFGYDHAAKQVVSPYEYFELMGYCYQAPLDQWPSKFTYEGLIPAISNRFAATPPPGGGGTHRVVRGRIDLATDNVTLHPMVTLSGNRAPKTPPTGDYIARLRNGAGQVIQDITFAPAQSEPRGDEPVTTASFILPVPEDPAIRQVEILHNGQVRGGRTASAHPPTVHLDFPNGGELLMADPITVTWTGADLDDDPLTYALQYSTDAGATWDTLAVDLRQTEHTMPRSMLTRTTMGRLRVIASDGFHTAVDASDANFTAANNPPTIQIKSPAANALLLGNQQLVLEAFAYDPDDDALDGTNVVWNSDPDGVLGSGASLFTNALALSEGPHLITATARDAFNETGTAQVHITVQHTAPASIADLAIAQTSEVTAEGLVLTLTAENLGPSIATGLKLTDEIPAGTSVLAATPTLGAVTVTNGLLTCFIPQLAVGQSAIVTLHLAVPSAGSVTNIADVKGLELDPNLANSYSQVVAPYQPAPPQLRIELNGNSVRISWPATTRPGFVLQSSPGLFPASWSEVPGIPDQLNGRFQVVQSQTNQGCYYRLFSNR